MFCAVSICSFLSERRNEAKCSIPACHKTKAVPQKRRWHLSHWNNMSGELINDVAVKAHLYTHRASRVLAFFCDDPLLEKRLVYWWNVPCSSVKRAAASPFASCFDQIWACFTASPALLVDKIWLNHHCLWASMNAPLSCLGSKRSFSGQNSFMSWIDWPYEQTTSFGRLPEKSYVCSGWPLNYAIIINLGCLVMLIWGFLGQETLRWAGEVAFFRRSLLPSSKVGWKYPG
jgi:hypothetical protein